MASISKDAYGNHRILFMGVRRKREVLYLGKIPLRIVRGVKTHIETLVASVRMNIPIDNQSSEWLAGLADDVYARLTVMGLAEERIVQATTKLGGFIDEYHAKRTDWKPNSIKNHKAARRWMLKFFGENRAVHTIGEGDAEDFRLYLSSEGGLAENTLRRICGFARQYFNSMLKRGMIKINPFGTMKNIAVQGNGDRFYYVTREEADKVMAALPTPEWRLIFALCRYGGFRCPSEHVALRWEDIDWQAYKITLDAPKTGVRVLPLFPELATAFCDVGIGTGSVFKTRQVDQNMRSQFIKYLTRAGISPWPKLFQNLRSTRETELMEKHPAHVVCAWIGNTETVAKKHYLQVNDEHFQKAIAKSQTPAHATAEPTENTNNLEIRPTTRDDKNSAKFAKNGNRSEVIITPVRCTNNDDS